MLFLLLCPPILSVLIFLSKIKNKGYASSKELYGLWFFISIVGIYWFPWGDTQSHFSVYYSDIVRQYYDYTITSTHWLYDLVIFYIAQITGNFQYGFLFWIYFPFAIFLYSLNKNKNEDIFMWPYVLYVIFAIGIREVLDLSRTTSAALFFVSSIMLYDKNKVFALCCILLSLLLHDTARIVLLFLPLFFIIGKLNNKQIVIIGALLVVVSMALLSRFSSYFLSERELNLYLSDDKINSTGVNSGLMRIMTYVNILIFLVNFYVIQKNRNVITKVHFNIHIILSLLVFAVFMHWVGRERLMIFYNIYAIGIIFLYGSQFSFSYLFGVNYLKPLMSMFILKILIICILTYAGRYVFGTACRNNSEELSIVTRSLYMPSFLLFDIDDFGFNDDEYNALYNRVIETNE